jgi:phosphate transport system protein
MRESYQMELNELLDRLVEMGDISNEMLDAATRALIDHDTDLAEATRRRDAEVDRRYEEVGAGIVRVLALQAPVASDLRLVSSMLHVNIHLERLGDYATSIAKAVLLSAELVDDPEIAQQLQEMGAAARQCAAAAVSSYARKDVDLARQLPEMDDPVDRLNIGIFHRLVRLAAQDEARLEWATHMILVARQIERYADHAVDIAEQTVFAVTGRFVELSSNAPIGSRK